MFEIGDMVRSVNHNEFGLEIGVVVGFYKNLILVRVIKWKDTQRIMGRPIRVYPERIELV